MSAQITVGILVTAAVILSTGVAVLASAHHKNKEYLFDYALRRSGFTKVDRKDLSDGGNKGIAIDLMARSILVYESDSPMKIVRFSEMNKCILIGGGRKPPKPAGRGQVLAGHAIGTALGGFWGGVIGGMLTDRPLKQKVKRIGIEIECGNSEPSVHTFIFQGAECEQGDAMYAVAMMTAEPWYKILNHIIGESGDGTSLNSAGCVTGTDEDAEVHFSCMHCGRRIKVASKHTGRKGKCPTCREILVVPRANAIVSESRRPTQQAETLTDKCALCARSVIEHAEISPSGTSVCTSCMRLLCQI